MSVSREIRSLIAWTHMLAMPWRGAAKDWGRQMDLLSAPEISNGTGSRGRLCPSFRTRMEAAFKDDFADLAVDTGLDAQRLTASLGTIACTDGHTLFFARGGYRPDTPAGQWVIAHELAHVVQKRRARCTPWRRAVATQAFRLEAEAHNAATAALLGEVSRELSADGSGHLRCWSWAGHYYTVYFALLAAGFTDEAAATAAFFCQMPDQVLELDAKTRGISWAANRINGGSVADVTVPLHRALMQRKNMWNTKEIDKESLEVEKGAHCLTGHDAAGEQAQRRANLVTSMRNKNDLAVFGLALHAFGDSFAHCIPAFPNLMLNTAMMFPAPAGHLIPGPSTDNIYDHERRYMTYATSLFGALLQAGHTPVFDKEGFERTVGTFCTDRDEPGQIRTIRRAAELFFPDHRLYSYAPEEPVGGEPDPIPWLSFCHKHCDEYQFDPGLIDRLQLTIRQWSW
jgi:hypothetical protein